MSDKMSGPALLDIGGLILMLRASHTPWHKGGDYGRGLLFVVGPKEEEQKTPLLLHTAGPTVQDIF